MSIEQNKAIARDFYESIKDVDSLCKVMDEHLAAKDIFHDPSFAGFEPGPEGAKNWVRQQPLYQMSITIKDMIGEGNKLAIRYEFRTRSQDGITVTNRGLVIWYFKDGKITDEWAMEEPLPEGVSV